MCVCNYRTRGWTSVSPVYGEAEDDAYLKRNLYFLSEIRDYLDRFSTKVTLIAK